jgi:hypothetical protein
MNKSIYLLAFASIVMSCETEDVKGIGSGNAEASIRSSRIAISENADSALVIVDLDIAAESNVVAQIGFSGTASFGADYGASDSEVRITEGSQSGSLTIFTFEDTDIEGTETIIARITGMTGARLGTPSSATVSLEDNDDNSSSFGLILNEILYDPSNSGLDGDANGDGQYAQSEDEFIEFVNTSSLDIDISGFKVYDASGFSSLSPNHTFPSGSLVASGKAIVLFGGGTPTGSFGGAVVQTSTSGNLSLNNAGDHMIFTNAADSVIIDFDITPLSDNPNESYTRNPDLTGDFEQHADNTPILFSPGMRRDASPF